MTFMEQLAGEVSVKPATVKELSQGTAGTIHKVNPLAIRVQDGFNLRDMTTQAAREHVEWLAASIAEIGLQKPLAVQIRDGAAFVVDGHCRLTAVKLAIERFGAEIKTVPVTFVDPKTSEPDLVVAMAGGVNEGLRLSVAEKAEGVARLLKWGWTHGNIAKRFGMPESRVFQLLDVARLPAEIKQEVKEGTISASLAVEAVKEAPSAQMAVTAVKEAVKENKTVHAAAKRTDPKAKLAKVKPAQVKPALAAPAKRADPNAADKEKLKAMDMGKKEVQEIIRTLFLKGKVQEKDKIVAVAWTRDDFEKLKQRLGL